MGSGKANFLVNAIYSANFSDFHTDLNLGATRLGQVSPGEGRIQIAWAAALSRNLNDRWGLAGELSGTWRRNVPSTAQFLTAVSYNLSKKVVLDAGVAFGLNHASPDWSLFAGATILVGKVH